MLSVSWAVAGSELVWVVTMHTSEDRLAAVHIIDARRGGFMNPRSNRVATNAILFQPVGSDRSASEERAFRKRVAKRRAKKGYR